MSYVDEVTADGPVNWWRFEVNAADSVGSNHITLGTGYSIQSPGVRGNALYSTSTESRTGCYTTGVHGLWASAYSIEMWFNYSDIVTNPNHAQELVRQNNELVLEMNHTGNILYWYQSSYGTTSASFDDSQWHHLVVTRDGAGAVKMYVDKTQVVSFSGPTSGTSAGNFYVGGSQYPEQVMRDSYLDEIALYDKALSLGRIEAHFDAGIAEDVVPSKDFRGWGIPL